MAAAYCDLLRTRNSCTLISIESASRPHELSFLGPEFLSNPRNEMQNLSDLEAKILRLLADGLSNQQIADRLSLTVRNVKYQTKKIYTKIGVGSRAALRL